MPLFLPRFSIFSKSLRGFADLANLEANAQKPFKIFIPGVSNLTDKYDRQSFEWLWYWLSGKKKVELLPAGYSKHRAPLNAPPFIPRDIEATGQNLLLKDADGVIALLGRNLSITDGLRIGYLQQWCEKLSKFNPYILEHDGNGTNYSGRIPILIFAPAGADKNAVTQLGGMWHSPITRFSVFRNEQDLDCSFNDFMKNMITIRSEKERHIVQEEETLIKLGQSL